MYDLIESFPESAAVNIVGYLEDRHNERSLSGGRAGGGIRSPQYSATSSKKSRPCVANSRVSTAALVGKAVKLL